MEKEMRMAVDKEGRVPAGNSQTLRKDKENDEQPEDCEAKCR
jgi:hypothetical protein